MLRSHNYMNNETPTTTPWKKPSLLTHQRGSTATRSLQGHLHHLLARAIQGDMADRHAVAAAPVLVRCQLQQQEEQSSERHGGQHHHHQQQQQDLRGMGAHQEATASEDVAPAASR